MFQKLVKCGLNWRYIIIKSLRSKKLSLIPFSKIIFARVEGSVLTKVGSGVLLVLLTFHIWSLHLFYASIVLSKIFILTSLLVRRLVQYLSVSKTHTCLPVKLICSPLLTLAWLSVTLTEFVNNSKYRISILQFFHLEIATKPHLMQLLFWW